jgi:hypothetical protein
MANLDRMQLTDAEKTKAARARMILGLVMFIFIILPLLVYWLRR